MDILLRIARLIFAGLLALLASCAMSEEKIYNYKGFSYHGSWGEMRASLNHAVLAEDIQRIGSGTFHLKLSASSVVPDVERISVASIELRRRDNGKVAYRFGGESDSSQPVENAEPNILGVEPFSSGRITLDYTNYDLSVFVDISTGGSVHREHVLGALVTDFRSHKTFDYWKALKGV